MAKELKAKKVMASGSKANGSISKVAPAPVNEGIDDDASTSGSEDEDDLDVSKKGLARLMQALGDDGLTDMDKAHLQLVAGGADEEQSEDDDDFDDEEGDEGEEASELDEEDLGSIPSDEDEDDEPESEEEETSAASVAKTNGKDSLAASLARSGLIAEEENDEEEEEEDEDDEEDGQGIPLESLSEAAFGALPESVRAARMYREKINNKEALKRIRQDIALGADSKKGSLPWIETLVISYNKSIEEELGGKESSATDDDLKRELEFYKQALYAAVQGRQLAKQADLAFTRPSDYFAEMVKSDEHMERVRQKLLDERAGLKASEEAKRQRELKKFGKKVQVEKQLERTKSRKELDERVKGLKRKRKGGLDGDDDDGGDDFDVQLESAISGKDNKRSRDDKSSRGRGGSNRGGRGGPKMNRDARDAKYGHGGKKRFAKENTRESTNDTSSSGVYRGRGGSRGSMRGGRGGSSRGAKRGASQRPGKARRSGAR
jgi:rRNA-processing protein EBP2